MGKTVIPSKILLPKNADLNKWATIACDQHTQENEYWDELKKEVGDSYSTLNLVFPEIFLKEDVDTRIKSINASMNKYLKEDIFEEREGYVLTCRTCTSGIKRLGLVAAINLDDYSYEEDDALIRSTEDTILERIPVRVKIREDAPIEFPHIMLLSSDTDYSYIEKLYRNKDKFEKLYDFDLNMNGGHIEGYFIPSSEDVEANFRKSMKDDVLFLVGDGNHSLAAAKTVWNNKKEKGITEDLTQYALVEIVNLMSDGIVFEPIHRLVKGVDINKFYNGIKLFIGGNGVSNLITKSFDKIISVPDDVPECYGCIDAYIENYIAENGGEVDYIHGVDVLEREGNKENCVGIVMPTLQKKDLFPSVSKYGPLPRKTFSMGEGDDKRYYLEGRKLK